MGQRFTDPNFVAIKVASSPVNNSAVQLLQAEHFKITQQNLANKVFAQPVLLAKLT